MLNKDNPLVDGADGGARLQASDDAQIIKPIVYELDPGMKYVVTAGQTVLGEMVVLTVSSVVSIYFTVQASLPAQTSSITLTASTTSSAPSSYTFKLTPAPGYSATTAPSASSTLFVCSNPVFGVIWGFTSDGNGGWNGGATFYNKHNTTIHLSAGTYTLNNNTTSSLLTWVAVDSAA